MTPLMAASFQGHVDIVRLLIDAKAQLNTREKEVCCKKYKSNPLNYNYRKEVRRDGKKLNSCTTKMLMFYGQNL